MVTLGYLKTKVLNKLQEDPFFSDQQLIDSINEGIEEVIAFARHTQQVSESTTVLDTATGKFNIEYQLPADFLYIRGVQVGTRDLTEMTLDEWRKLGGPNSTITGSPSRFYVRNNMFVGLSPRPSAVEDILIYYVDDPTDLVLDTDASALNRVHARAVVHYACYDLLMTDNRKDEAEWHWQKYLMKRAETATNLNMNRKRKVKRV